MLRGRIGLNPGEARAQPSTRGDVDDTAVACAAHRLGGGLCEPERAVRVGAEDRVPAGLLDLVDRAADLAAHTAGGIDEDVEPAFHSDDLLDHRMASGPVADVEPV